MNIEATALPEVKRVTLPMRRDARGYFVERYNPQVLAALGISAPFVQLNHSRSLPGVIRGVHFQYAPAQGKLIGVTRGKVLDIAVDLRPHSPNFKKHVAVQLSDEGGELLWIPTGFGHGFCVLGNEPADVVYGVDAPYSAAGEAGVAFDDAALAIAWPISNPIISERDRVLPSVAELTPHLREWFAA